MSPRRLLTAATSLLVVLFAHLASAAPAPPAEADSVVVLDTAQGRIVIRLATVNAPRTCANFRRLAATGYYDSTCFHRVVAGFVIQGGDPASRDADPANDGAGGPGWTVPAEASLPHVRGAVAMARTPDAANPRRDSHGSQFYVCLADRPDLDRTGGTVFGQVIAGLDVVDRIAALGSLPGLPRSAAGANPGRRALVRRAVLEPLGRWQPAAARATPAP